MEWLILCWFVEASGKGVCLEVKWWVGGDVKG